MLSVVPALCLG